MTTGERIAALRRGRNLSQEALGEALGVSRQAISKWEADTSLPEVDKLVALSRMFGVTVGELLGVEEGRADAPQAESDELTEQQIRMVEEIAARYIEAIPQPEPKKTNRKKQVLAGVAGALVLALVVWQFGSMRSELQSLRNQTNSLQNNVSNISSNVGYQISSISDRVEEVLKSQNNLTADYGCTAGKPDLASDTVTFDAYAVPKRWVEGMTAEFLVQCGEETLTFPGAAAPGNRFAAAVTVPLDDHITVSVRFDTDGVQETQLLEVFEGLAAQTIPQINWDFSFFFWCDKTEEFRNEREYELRADYWWLDQAPADDYRLSDVQAWLAVNGEPVALGTTGRIVAEGEAIVAVSGDTGGGEAAAELKSTLTVTVPALDLKVGDTIQPYLTMTDNYGRRLRADDQPLYVGEDGRLEMGDGSVATRLIEE